MNMSDKTTEGPNTAVSNNDCNLCKREEKTQKHYEDEFVWVVDCKTCKESALIVWKEHKHYLEPKELKYVWGIVVKLFGAFATQDLDTNMNTNANHWNAHLRPKK